MADKVSKNQLLFLQSFQKRKRLIILCRIAIFICFIGLWELMTQIGIMDDFIFSSPSRICRTFWSMAMDGSIFYHTAITLLETFVSFFLVMFLGIGLTILFWWKTTLSDILEPYLIALNSLPKTALAPIFIVWLGNNMKTIIVCAISLAIFGTIINLYSVFITTEPDKLLLVQTFGGSRTMILKKVILPANRSAIMSVMKVNIGLCLVGVIIGEFLAANAGLGYLIIYGSQVFKLDWVLMSICLLCLIAIALYGLIGLFKKKFQSGS